MICITETWLTPFILNNEILPTNYTVYRRDRGSRSGGILVAVSERIPSKSVYISSSVELMAIQLSLHPLLLLYCVYLPPSCSSTHYSDVLSSLNSI